MADPDALDCFTQRPRTPNYPYTEQTELQLKNSKKREVCSSLCRVFVPLVVVSALKLDS